MRCLLSEPVKPLTEAQIAQALVEGLQVVLDFASMLLEGTAEVLVIHNQEEGGK